jgi:hypothetical protein
MNPTEDPGLLSGLLHFLAFMMLGSGLLQVLARPQDVRFQTKIFVIGLAVRFGFSLIIYQFGLISIIKDEDGSGWLIGMDWAERWLKDGATVLDLPTLVLQAYQAHHKGYYYVVGAMFFLTGTPTRLAAAALNCFFGAMIANLCYSTARMLFPQRIAVQVGWWTCLYPSLILWSAQTIKEPVVILLEGLAIFACVALQQQGFSFKNVLLIAGAILLLVPFRFYAAYLTVATIILGFLLRTMFAGGKLSAGSLTGAIVVCSGVFLLSASMLGREKSENAVLKQYDLKGIQKMRDYGAARTNSGVKVEYDLDTPVGLGGSIVVGATYLLLAPFPWQLLSGSLRMLMVGPEVMLWWWLLFTGVIPGMRKTIPSRLADVLPLLITLFGLGLLYSITFYNVGLVYRQRAQLLPWLLIFAAVGRDKVGQLQISDGRLQIENSKGAPRTLQVAMQI